jgi:hypothetical protein
MAMAEDAPPVLPIPSEAPPDLPESVTLAAPYAYYDVTGGFHAWTAGQSVADAGQVADLIARQAPLKD